LTKDAKKGDFSLEHETQHFVENTMIGIGEESHKIVGVSNKASRRLSHCCNTILLATPLQQAYPVGTVITVKVIVDPVTKIPAVEDIDENEGVSTAVIGVLAVLTVLVLLCIGAAFGYHMYNRNRAQKEEEASAANRDLERNNANPVAELPVASPAPAAAARDAEASSKGAAPVVVEQPPAVQPQAELEEVLVDPDFWRTLEIVEEDFPIGDDEVQNGVRWAEADDGSEFEI